MNLHSICSAKRTNSYQILEPIIYRWSGREMNGLPITEEQLRPLFEAARWAPSCFNDQPWRFYYALRDTESFQKLFNLLFEKNQQWCQDAGCLMVMVSKTTFNHNGKPMRTHAFDTGSAWQALSIEGVNRGYVVHGMAGFDYDAAERVLNLTDEYCVNCMIAVGHPAPEAEQESITQRKEVQEFAIPL